MPLVSIIIPCFNSAGRIITCLESIAPQVFKDYEIIIIDGVSNDGTQEMVAKYRAEHPQINIKLTSEPDNGIYDAMNKGIDHAAGDWLLFLGSDDVLYDAFVLENIAKKLPFTHSKVVYGNVMITGHAGWAGDGTIYDGTFDLKKILEKNICHQAIFYNKEVFKELGGYNQRYKVCADYEFNLRCFARHRFEYADVIVSKFHGGGTSIVNDDVNFANDQVPIILSNFRSQLYRKEFIPFRPYIKKVLAEKKYPLTAMTRLLLLLNNTYYRINSYKNRLFHALKNG